ncbi:RluA family pseudouridine synthase [Alkalilimnicola sp. S0819]|uniref:RluA family pseudouridine synthase n=1 Tax=Alkalilimnicola sp. S0819 TaxID=2613922 RepID=UPI001D032A0E|nr:RluA family pseudouridine synthase [Alkalilimnicola sp. S0819]
MNTTANHSRGGVRRVRVNAEGAGQRIDNFLLRELKGLPRSRVYKLLRKGEVRVNGGRIGPTYKLRAADEVRIPPVRLEAPNPSAPRVPAGLRERLLSGVLHEDERLLVLDKPPGIPVHGGSGQAWGLIEALRELRPELPFLELAHRLDRDTSGCLVLAKKRSALREVHEALREGRAEKKYLTLLKGRLPRGALPVEAPLDKRERRGGERTVTVSAAGKAARTVFRTVRRLGFATLVEAEIATGRTHQIRVHAAHAGHPVLGDDRYGDRDANRDVRRLGLKRIFLHAHSLHLRLAEGRELLVDAPLSADLRAVLDAAEKEGA